MKHEASETNKKITKISDLKNGVVAMLSATLDTLVCKVQKHDVCQCIDNLCGIICGIIVLLTISRDSRR